MPVHRTTAGSKPAYQWGEHGKKYTFKAGDKASRRAAKAKATAQGQAAHANGYRG